MNNSTEATAAERRRETASAGSRHRRIYKRRTADLAGDSQWRRIHRRRRRQQPPRARTPVHCRTNRAARRRHQFHRGPGHRQSRQTEEPDRATNRGGGHRNGHYDNHEQISAIQTERDDARQNLRDTLTDVNDKVERTEDEMRPDRIIESHAVGAALIAGALGFFFGSIVNSRGAGPIVIAALLGVAISKHGSNDES